MAEVSLRPGDLNYRAYVGRAECYDLMAGLQFSLLVLLGLREQHYLLDIGCGSLRGGRLFIPYLLAGRYFGLEPNRWLVEEGIRYELGEELFQNKRPTFAYNSDFNLEVFGVQFDVVLAQSIFSHTGLTQLRACLASAARVLRPDGLLIATFVERKADLARDEWVYPGLNHFSWATITAACREVGLLCYKLDWPHPLQTWFVAAFSLDRLKSLWIDVLPDDLILTGWRYRERRAGRLPGFYYPRNAVSFIR